MDNTRRPQGDIYAPGNTRAQTRGVFSFFLFNSQDSERLSEVPCYRGVRAGGMERNGAEMRRGG